MTQTAKKVSAQQHSDAHTSASIMTAHTEQTIALAKEAFDHVATKAREAMAQGMKTVDAMTGMTRGNVDALIESSRIASNGLQAIAQDVTDFSKQALERTATAAQSLSQAKTAPELVQLQNDFAQAQFSHAVGEYNKLSQTMFKTMTEIFEPLQKRAVIAAQIKDLMNVD